MTSKRLSPALLACALALAVTAEAQREQNLSLPDGVRLRIAVPAGYSYETQRNQFGAALVKMENPVWQIAVAAIVSPEPDRANTTREWQENRLITFVADALAIAAEKDYEFQPLYPKSGSGVFLVFTDPRVAKREPLPPGEYAHLVGGVKAWPGTTIVFQILTNSITTPEFEEMMTVFRESFVKR
jgi:hypothetical protein